MAAVQAGAGQGAPPAQASTPDPKSALGRFELARSPEGSLALLTGSVISPVRSIVDGGAVASLLTGGLLLIVFDLIRHVGLGEYITAATVGGGLVVVGGLLAWAAHRSNAKERLASLEANKEIRLAALRANRELGTDLAVPGDGQTPGPGAGKLPF